MALGMVRRLRMRATIATVLRPEHAISHAGSAGRPAAIVTLAVELAEDRKSVV